MHRSVHPTGENYQFALLRHVPIGSRDEQDGACRKVDRKSAIRIGSRTGHANPAAALHYSDFSRQGLPTFTRNPARHPDLCGDTCRNQQRCKQ
jgi:hypothetical protein